MNSINNKIMVFDDDISILDVFSLVFEASGYVVHAYQNTQNIIDKVTSVQPSLIIMDNSIPNTGGIEAVKLIKSQNLVKHIPVIYCSANNDISNLSSQAGADAYLSKPFDLDELERLVKELLAKVRKYDETH